MNAEAFPVSRGTDDLARHLADAGIDVAACYQCGRCSAGCPVAEFFDLKPMQVVRMCCYGMEEEVLASSTIWLCASCETCTTRCPNGIDIAGMMDVLRSRSLSSKRPSPQPRITAFHKAFLKSVRRHGRVFEMEMIAQYKLGSRDFLGDMALGIEMLKRGKLKFLPTRIKETGEVRSMFKKEKEKK